MERTTMGHFWYSFESHFWLFSTLKDHQPTKIHHEALRYGIIGRGKEGSKRLQEDFFKKEFQKKTFQKFPQNSKVTQGDWGLKCLIFIALFLGRQTVFFATFLFNTNARKKGGLLNRLFFFTCVMSSNLYQCLLKKIKDLRRYRSHH